MELKEALKRTIEKEGREILSDSMRLKAHLNDLAPEEARDVRIITDASKEHYFDGIARCSENSLPGAMGEFRKSASSFFAAPVVDKICGILRYGLNMKTDEIIITNKPEFSIIDGELTGYGGASLSVKIPEGVTSISERAFYDSPDIQEVIIPEGVTVLKENTFRNFTNLKRVVLPSTLETIEANTFSGCTNLENIVLPESMRRIGKEAFKISGKLKSTNVFGRCIKADVKLYIEDEELAEEYKNLKVIIIDPKKSSGVPKWLIIAGAAVVIALCVLIPMFGSKKTSAPKELEPTSEPTSETTPEPTPSPAATTEPEKIVFGDSALNKKIHEYLGTDLSQEITADQALSITELDSDGGQDDIIYSLEGIENLKNLTSLHLHNHQISDLTPLSQLSNLKKLGLKNNNITDISSLSNCNRLERLGLDGNFISDISALSGCTNLQVLYLTGNQISDISALSGMKKMKELYIEQNSIENIKALSSMNQLKYLYMNDNITSDISPLSELYSLERLSLRGNRISDCTPLSALTSLQRVGLENNRISDITPLGNLVNLEELYLGGNNISSKQINWLTDKLKKCNIHF